MSSLNPALNPAPDGLDLLRGKDYTVEGERGVIVSKGSTFLLTHNIGMGPPARDASKVLECGLSYFIVRKWSK